MDATTVATTPVPGWETLFPWLRAGTTRRTAGNPDRALAGRWRSVVGSRQVHGARSRVHAGVAPGVCRLGEGDGHVTRSSGVLLTVTLADCVPVFVVDPVARAVGLFHAGWRGTAAGVVESGVRVLSDAFGSDPGELVVHLGPAICGACYEVGPEVFAALGEMPPPGPAPIDLRGAIRRRAVRLGVPDGQVTASDECTLCGDSRYFSHRRGDTGRHLGFIGILPRAGGLRGGRGDNVGLCGRCAQMRTVESRRGSVFHLCGRHRGDPTFPKYPPLPVLRCRGFAPNPQDEPE